MKPDTGRALVAILLASTLIGYMVVDLALRYHTGVEQLHSEHGISAVKEVMLVVVGALSGYIARGNVT